MFEDKKKLFIYIAFVVFFPVFVLLLMTVFDSIFPQIGLRYYILVNSGAPLSRDFISIFEPADMGKKEIPKNMYWYFRSPGNIDPKGGYICVIEGILLNKESNFWKVASDKSQDLRVLNFPEETNYYFIETIYNEDSRNWEKKFLDASVDDFNVGDIVWTAWDCPLINPKEMLTKDKKLKEEFLEINSLWIAKEKE